jgi:hypothetical protein
MDIKIKNNRLERCFPMKDLIAFLHLSDAWNILIDALDEADILKIELNNIFFCQTVTPACTANIKFNKDLNFINFISLDSSIFKKYTEREQVAIILHEIGHIFFPSDDINEKEFNADSFAASKGFAKEIILTLNSSPLDDARKKKLLEIIVIEN